MDHIAHWIEIPVENLDRAQYFYETIFQVKLDRQQVTQHLTMAIFPVPTDGMGGALCHHPDFYCPGRDGPVVYLNANPDLQLILDRVEPAGGKILIPKRQVSEERGFMALFEDSEGNRMALHSKG